MVLTQLLILLDFKQVLKEKTYFIEMKRLCGFLLL